MLTTLEKNLQCLSQPFILIFVVLRRGEVQLHDGESNTGGQGWLQGIRTVRTRKEFNDISKLYFQSIFGTQFDGKRVVLKCWLYMYSPFRKNRLFCNFQNTQWKR